MQHHSLLLQLLNFDDFRVEVLTNVAALFFHLPGFQSDVPDLPSQHLQLLLKLVYSALGHLQLNPSLLLTLHPLCLQQPSLFPRLR